MTAELWSRRTIVRMMALAGLTPLLRGNDDPWITQGDYQTRLETFYNETDTRPDFVWVNREDVMYHDHDYPPALAGAPEYCAFIKKAWVFNRAMHWIRNEGAILCYEDTGILNLTGENQVSAWHTGPDNTLKNEHDFSVWTKHSRRRRDCLVLPAFQFHVGQHPVVEVEADGGDGLDRRSGRGSALLRQEGPKQVFCVLDGRSLSRPDSWWNAEPAISKHLATREDLCFPRSAPEADQISVDKAIY